MATSVRVLNANGREMSGTWQRKMRFFAFFVLRRSEAESPPKGAISAPLSCSRRLWREQLNGASRARSRRRKRRE